MDRPGRGGALAYRPTDLPTVFLSLPPYFFSFEGGGGRLARILQLSAPGAAGHVGGLGWPGPAKECQPIRAGPDGMRGISADSAWGESARSLTAAPPCA